MFEVKQSQSVAVPVRLFDASDVPIAGVLFSAVTVTVVKSNGTTATYTPNVADWDEVTAGAAASQGLYQLTTLTTDTDTTGPLLYVAKTASSKAFIGSIKVVANEEVDTFGRIGAPSGASISADIQTRAPSATALSTVQWTNTRATNLDNLDALVSSRAPASTALSTVQWTNTRATNLDNLDATVSSRSTFAGGAVASVTGNVGGNVVGSVGSVVGLTASNLDATISSRAPASTALSTVQWTNTRATNLDNLNATISSRATVATIWDELLAGHLTAGTAGKALSDASAGSSPALIAAAVWDEPVASHLTVGSTGATLKRVQVLKEGRWKLFDSGPDANRVVLYAEDGTTVIQKWDAKDKTGAASNTEIYERVPVLVIP